MSYIYIVKTVPGHMIARLKRTDDDDRRSLKFLKLKENGPFFPSLPLSVLPTSSICVCVCRADLTNYTGDCCSIPVKERGLSLSLSLSRDREKKEVDDRRREKNKGEGRA